MPLPFLAAGLAAGKEVAKSGAVARVGEGLQGLVGDTSKDRSRRERAAALERSAMAGDAMALRQLAFDAFETADGMPGDNRPIDKGKRSPPLTRDLSRAALQRYAARFGGLPTQLTKYAAQLSVPVNEGRTPFLEAVLTPTVDTITDRAIARAAERSSETAQKYLPLIIGAGVLALVLFYSMRTSK